LLPPHNFGARVTTVPGFGVRDIHSSLLTSAGRSSTIGPVSTAEIDAYLANVDEPKRSTLQRLRRAILEVIPDAEEGISYGLPAFRVQDKVVAGFAAFKSHLSYLPHSGSVFPVLRDELGAYKTSTGALRFPIDSPLPKLLVEHLVKVRVAQAFPDEQELAAADPAM
jgi:uncharacterized protein YdhG (YjbR/CyaY superfamily)